ncbi:lipase (class 3) domain-containing protein [Hirsutella rhossiliensis]|uniref:Lipase (Class 3) domain-containing protein n=1 Tax=Hirsutella rhossiliensis TaxID=111463 RepID=A0A9P8SFP9_9HYPO|nr:lipase (class 3) domain-containing protein [Hirsutella rhossiliensis]KAH0960274.1 lipase (class 3) domain-containing protein [Hirsutella rhossiliensis]
MRSTAGPLTVLAVLRLAAAAAVNMDMGMDMDNSTLHARAWQAKDSGAEFEVFAQYSSAAYCDELYDGFDRTPVCSNPNDRACPNFRDTTTVSEFLNDDFYGVGGFIASNPTRRHTVVVFKGTNSMFDVGTDMTKGLTACDLCDGCLVHSGFYTALNRIRPELERAVRAERRRPDRLGFRLVITGHSLGGALATLAAVHLRNAGIPCDVYTYGAPRIGNDRLAAHVAAQRGFTARITNARDIVAAIPNYGWMIWYWRSYAHHYPEYWYPDGLDRGTKLYDLPRRVCLSDGHCSSAVCNSPWRWATWRGCSLQDHLSYIGRFEPCAGGGRGRGGMGRSRQAKSGFRSRLPDPRSTTRWLQ